MLNLNGLFSFNSSVMPASETIDKVQLSFLEYLAEEEAAKQQNYTQYREYYDGDHDTQLSPRMRQYLQIKNSQEFNANYCPIVVDAVAERLIVTGFDAGEQGEIFWEWWNANRMDGQQRIVHTGAGRDGDTYAIVSWSEDENRPVITPELAFDGHEGVKVHYSHEQRDKIEFATKKWRVEIGKEAGYVRRLNVYHPNRIEKYISYGNLHEGNWRPHIEEGEDDYIQWWTDNGLESGNPLGVAVKHFKANDRGYNYGKSDLHDIIPIQNALNKSVIDLLAAADTTAFRMYVMIGDDPRNLTFAPGMVVYSLKPPGGPEGASFNAISGEDLAPLIAIKDTFVTEIARISRTPLSYFQASGQVSAEGTLKQQESGLVSKVQDRQVGYGNTWEDIIKLARRLNNVFGTGPKLDEAEPVSTMWADAELRNELDHVNAIGVKVEKLKIPLETAWQEAGYNPDEIVAMMETAEYKALLAASLATGFEAGQLPIVSRWRLMGHTDKEINQMLADKRREDGFGLADTITGIDQ